MIKAHRHMDFRVIIAGGRDFIDKTLLYRSMEKVLVQKIATHNVIIISGDAKGADTIGADWAKWWGFPVEHYPANWAKYGRVAGPIRNRWMADVAQALVVFWDGISPGTKSMIRIGAEHGLDTRIIKYDTGPRSLYDAFPLAKETS